MAVVHLIFRMAGIEIIGDLSGSGTVLLGSNGLSVTETDNTTFSGNIVDGGIGGGIGGSLTMGGSGTLTLTGANSFTGGMTIGVWHGRSDGCRGLR